MPDSEPPEDGMQGEKGLSPSTYSRCGALRPTLGYSQTGGNRVLQQVAGQWRPTGEGQLQAVP